VLPKEGSFSDVVGNNTRRSFHLLVGATLTIATSIVGSFLTSSLTGEQSWWSRLGWLTVGIAITFFYLRWQLRSQEGSLEAIKERVSQLQSELRKQVQARSYGTRRNLIEAPLRELDLDITPRLGWVMLAQDGKVVSIEQGVGGNGRLHRVFSPHRPWLTYQAL
jgi:hypothetical protein